MPDQKRRRPRGIIDTSVVVAGVAGFKSPDIRPSNPSAAFIRKWAEQNNFVWLVTEEILEEYKSALQLCVVRRSLIGKIINGLDEDAESILLSSLPAISPDPGDDPFCACAEQGFADFIVTLNPRHFPQHLLSAHVINPADRIPTTRRERRSQRK